MEAASGRMVPTGWVASSGAPVVGLKVSPCQASTNASTVVYTGWRAGASRAWLSMAFRSTIRKTWMVLRETKERFWRDDGIHRTFLGGRSPRSLNNLQYLLGVWDGAFLSWEGGKEACHPRLRTECTTWVSSPRCSKRLLGCWYSCDIDPPSSVKNIIILYVMVEVLAQLGLIRVHKIANVALDRQMRIGGKPNRRIFG
ncbi:hypothetical protein BHE74_00034397 [Ensete ventricosum]|nr:hypothetical protein BHE74_00034397 [Ensete ventricosum]